MRHLERLGPHRVKTVASKLLGGPLDRLLELRRAAQARADAIGQPRELVPRAVVDERRTDDPSGDLVDILSRGGRRHQHQHQRRHGDVAIELTHLDPHEFAIRAL